MGRKKHRKQQVLEDEFEINFKGFTYTITRIPDDFPMDSLDEGLMKEKLEEYTKIRSENPEAAVPFLWDLIEDFPQFFYSYVMLGSHYLDRGDLDSLKIVSELALKEHPDSLRILTMLGQDSVVQQFENAIPPVFQNKTTLKELYPRKTHYFHADFAVFTFIMGWYFFRMNDLDQCLQYTLLLEKYDLPLIKEFEDIMQSMIEELKTA